MASKNTPAATRTCLCSPTTHPGSFRCSIHRNIRRLPCQSTARISSKRLEIAMIAKANALKAFLIQMIKPSSHDLRRRRNFQPNPTRFCPISANGDGVAVS